MSEQTLCEICGLPMPEGETMFKYHGYSGPCPGPRIEKLKPPTVESLQSALATAQAEIERLREIIVTLTQAAHDRVDNLTRELERMKADGERLDYLEREVDAEREAIRNTTPMPHSLFRRNTPITRAAIDSARGKSV